MKKVILGLSGGVDSSVSAYLLKQEGYEVHGLYIKNFDSLQNDDINLEDAKLVALKLGIELTVIDLVDKNKDLVFNYFIDDYKNGRTPSPCMICNREIKFKAFLDIAKKLKADYIATGHYVKVINEDNHYYLAKGKDLKKDQSYFLALLKQEDLSKILFPLGDYTKEEVRKIASEIGIVTASKKDSMDICFVGKDKFNDFIKTYIPIKQGLMMTLDGKVIKKHDGLQFYTIGQRKGLDIGGLNGYLKEPWFVVGKDQTKNILYIGQGYHNEYLYSNKALCKMANHLADLDETKIYKAVFRYHGEIKQAKIQMINENEFYIYYELERAVTPGQACVVYDDDKVVLGGLIEEVYMDGSIRKYK